MASSINSVSHLVAVIRAQLAAQSGRSPARKVLQAQSSTGGAVPQAELESIVREKIRRIDRNDPGRGKKAFRVFLETILLDYFGEKLINEPRFQQMVDDVQSTMESDTDVNAAINAAVQHLLTN